MSVPPKKAPAKRPPPYTGPPELLTVRQLMNKVMEEVHVVRKDQRNPQQGYNFRGIDAVVNAVGPAFRKYGIIPTPHKIKKIRYRDVQTSTGKPSREVTCKVIYRFTGPRGDYIKAEVPGESMDFGDKGSPKAMSVAYRIALLQVLCIPTDEPDPDASSYERVNRATGEVYDDGVLVERKTDAEWLVDAQQAVDMDDEEALLDIGRKVNAAGQWQGQLKDQLLALRATLLEKRMRAQQETPPAQPDGAPGPHTPPEEGDTREPTES